MFARLAIEREGDSVCEREREREREREDIIIGLGRNRNPYHMSRLGICDSRFD